MDSINHRQRSLFVIDSENHRRAISCDDQPKIIERAWIKKKFPIGQKPNFSAKQISFNLPPYLSAASGKAAMSRPAQQF